MAGEIVLKYFHIAPPDKNGKRRFQAMHSADNYNTQSPTSDTLMRAALRPFGTRACIDSCIVIYTGGIGVIVRPIYSASGGAAQATQLPPQVTTNTNDCLQWSGFNWMLLLEQNQAVYDISSDMLNYAATDDFWIITMGEVW